jgi:Flp pilus assembly protein TadG
MMGIGRIGRLGRANGGNTALEFAIIAPVFLLLLLGTIEFARLCWTQSTLQQAVEAAARCASVNTTICDNATDTASYAAKQMYGLSVSSGIFTATLNTSCGSNSGNLVSANLPFSFIVSWFNQITGAPLNVKAQSCFPANAN